MAAPTFDLQAHSVCSDGELAPAAVVAAAARAGVELLALTDHDTVEGVAEAREAARREGVRLVAATELSAVDPGHVDVHVLGYAIDERDEAFRVRLEDFRADRERRVVRMVDALEALGFEVARGEIDRRRAAGEPVGRPHVAQAVFEAAGNAPRLREEGLGSASAVLEAYLVEGAPAFVGRTHPTVSEAIGAIHGAGGLAVWAHPFWDVEARAEAVATLDRFVAAGVDGVEAFYITHTREQTLLLADAAAERGLLTTGSADFHGPSHPTFHAFRAFALFGREPYLGGIARAS